MAKENGNRSLNRVNKSLTADVDYENELNLNLDNLWVKKAEHELNEFGDNRSMKLNQLKERIVQDSEIPISRRDTPFLLRFLRAKKFDVDKSFRMIKKYLKMKREWPELFRISPVTEMEDFMQMQMNMVLPHYDDNGSAVYIFRVQNCDPHKCRVEKVFRTNIMALENAIRDPRTQVGGIVLLIDMTGLKVAHAKYLSPHLAKKSADVLQDAFPMRFKAFHILHEPFYFDAILALVKPFVTEKIRNRIYTHGNNFKSLHKHIPKDILPAEYGGKQGKFDNTKWREQIIGDEDYFVRMEMYKCDLTTNINDLNLNADD